MDAKQPYVKPELVMIELKAEEILATGCKNNTRTTSRPPLPPVGQCGVAIGCNVRGS